MSKDAKVMDIAARLRLARQQAGLSQGQVAKLLGMHRPSVSEAEAGRRKITAEESSEFARIYGVSVSWLVDGESALEKEDGDKLKLAARELAQLKADDLNKLLELLQSLKTKDKG